MLSKQRLTGTLAAAAMLVAISGCGGAKPAGTGSTGSTTPPLAAVTQPTTTAPPTVANGAGPAPTAAPAPTGGTNAQPATPATGAVSQPTPAAQPAAVVSQPASQPAKQPAAPASTPAPQPTAPTTPTPPKPPAPPATTPPATTSPQSGSLAFTTIGRGQQSSGTERRAVLLQNDASMNVQGVRPQQAVDFNQESVLIVYMGEQNTGGYSVEITSVQLEGGKLVVTVKQNRPSPNAMVTQALTQPYHAVKIPKVPAGTQVSVNWL